MSDERWAVRLLGPTEVSRDGIALSVGGAKVRLLLAMLALRVGRVVSADALIEGLWPDAVPKNALATLQVHMSALRRALVGPDGANCVVTRAPGYVLTIDPDNVDIVRYERLVEQARALAAGRVDEAAALLRTAETLWRGDAFADLAGEPALQLTAHALESSRQAAFEQRVELDLVLGRHVEAIAELETFVASHPDREGAVGSLMLALYRAGRQADALATYRRARHALIEELGLEPGPALQALERAILAQSPELDLGRRGVRGQATSDHMSTTIVGSDAAPDAHLSFDDGTRVEVGQRCTIGRHPSSKVVIDDPKASRDHAVIRVAVDAHVITDLGSTNGTRVNGELVVERRLDSGDVIRIAGVTLRYEVG